jgi:hypothetical protein
MNNILEPENEIGSFDEFMISLDDIDKDFILIVLDILEYYELFKMCLMLCNRYGLHERVGKYFISIASKYSNLNQLNFQKDVGS